MEQGSFPAASSLAFLTLLSQLSGWGSPPPHTEHILPPHPLHSHHITHFFLHGTCYSVSCLYPLPSPERTFSPSLMYHHRHPPPTPFPSRGTSGTSIAK